jgi:hypothetical protein
MPRIFEKKVNGITIGFIVGYLCVQKGGFYFWDSTERPEDKKYVRSIRDSLTFTSRIDAQRWLDKMESKRVQNVNTFEDVTKESLDSANA